METAVSAIAAILTTVAFIPQALTRLFNRRGFAVSRPTGVSFWFAFGVLLWNWPMMIANAVTFMLTLVIVGMKLYLK